MAKDGYIKSFSDIPKKYFRDEDLEGFTIWDAYISNDDIEDFIEYRVARNKPLTAIGMKRILNACVFAEKLGHHASAVLGHVIDQNWFGYKKSWAETLQARYGLIKNPELPPVNIPVESPGNSAGLDYHNHDWAAGMELAPNKKEH